jgi:hypothetical protein
MQIDVSRFSFPFASSLTVSDNKASLAVLPSIPKCRFGGEFLCADQPYAIAMADDAQMVMAALWENGNRRLAARLHGSAFFDHLINHDLP